MKQLHPIQLQILKKLLFAKSLRYIELKPSEDMENNQFDFHLDQMIAADFIKKTDSGYLLTSIGKEYANRMDTDQTMISKQAKVSVIVCPTRKTKTGTEYLLYTRLKHPFYGCQGFPSGKVKYGEKIIDAGGRELTEETNLKGIVELMCIKHFRVFDKTTNELVEDKFSYFCVVKDPTGELVESNEGRYEWVKEKDLFTYVTNHFESMDRFKEDIRVIQDFNGQIAFDEIDTYTEKF